MNRLTACTLVLTAVASWVSPAGVAATEPAAVSTEGLQLIEKDSRGEIYAAPDVEWSAYTQIHLEDATVAFRKNWQRDQNRGDPFKVDAADMEKIKSEMSALFHEVFAEELTKNGGYVLVDSSGPDVLSITPAIVDLDVAAPDTQRPYNSKQFTESAGKMTLKLSLNDSVTGALLATASDRREAPRRGYYQWTNSVTNRAEARRMFVSWADGLRKRLDAARSGETLTAAK